MNSDDKGFDLRKILLRSWCFYLYRSSDRPVPLLPARLFSPATEATHSAINFDHVSLTCPTITLENSTYLVNFRAPQDPRRPIQVKTRAHSSRWPSPYFNSQVKDRGQTLPVSRLSDQPSDLADPCLHRKQLLSYSLALRVKRRSQAGKRFRLQPVQLSTEPSKFVLHSLHVLCVLTV